MGPLCWLEDLSILLNVYFDNKIEYIKWSPIHPIMEEDYPHVVNLAKCWAREKGLDNIERLEKEDIYNKKATELTKEGKAYLSK